MTEPSQVPLPPSQPAPSQTPVRSGVSVPDLLVALGITLVGVIFLLGALKIPFGINAVVGPRLFPLIVSIGTILVGGLLTINVLRGERAEPGAEEDTDPDAPVSLTNPAIILGGFLLGAVLLAPLGFVVGTAIMYFSVAFAFGERRYGLMVLVSLIVAFITYVVFTHGLGLTLPAGLLKGII